MAFSSFQLEICRLLASRRAPEPVPQSYLAGGATLNALLDTPRLSRDLDLFHDTLEALDATWNLDRATLLSAGYDVEILRERSGFVEVLAARNGESVLLQWVRDSAFRFFPLVPHRDLGLTRIRSIWQPTKFWLWWDASKRAIGWTRSNVIATFRRSDFWRGPRAAKTKAGIRN